jgi:enamine deaminase RidA (YjgF/YER057c/UK114 family)
MTIKRFGDATMIADMVVHGGIAYLAGQVAEDPVSPSVYEQTKNILKQIDDLLAQANSDKTRLLKTNIWLSDIATFAEMNKAWGEWVPKGQAPARATKSRPKLAGPQWKVEIMADGRLHRLALGVGVPRRAPNKRLDEAKEPK